MARARTERRQANERAVGLEAQLHIALDNLPGALVYTDHELNIVLCNDRFKEMYPAPRALLQPGRPYPNFLRHLAENGYYGGGDLDALVAERVESLRNPSGKTFEDHTPDGRTYRIRRSRVVGGGTVTVMTDAIEQKRRHSSRPSAARRNPTSASWKRTRCWNRFPPGYQNISRHKYTTRSSVASKASR